MIARAVSGSYSRKKGNVLAPDILGDCVNLGEDMNEQA